MFLPFLLVCLATLCAGSLPTYTINLNAPAFDRWRDVALNYRWALPAMVVTFRNWLNEKDIRGDDLVAWQRMAEKTMTPDLLEELRGYVHYVNHSEVTLQIMTVVQATVELGWGGGCSSVLAATPNGTVVHGRNMDYQLPFVVNGATYDFPDVTFQATYVRDGSPIMTGILFAMQLGVSTGMRFNGWTIALHVHPGGYNRSANLRAGLAGGVIAQLYNRIIMESVTDFRTARARIEKTSYAMPCFLIMAGSKPWEGAVLTIGRQGAPGDCPPRPLSKEQWVILQTNDDYCGPALDQRRPQGNVILAGTEEDMVDAGNVMNFMRIPLLNRPKWTVFSWIGIPATGFSSTVLAPYAKKVPEIHT